MKKTITILIVLFVALLTGCNKMKKDIVHSVSPERFVSSYDNYKGDFKNVTSMDLTFQIPSNVEVKSESFDGLVYCINADGNKNQSYYIIAIPFEVNPEDAYSLLRPLQQRTFGMSPTLRPFSENNVNGVYADINDGDLALLCGETFCFNKKGFTFYVFSYAATGNYYSVFDIVKTIQPLTDSISTIEKKEIAEKMKMQYEKEILKYIVSSIKKDIIIRDYFDCSDVKVDLDNNGIKCVLIGDYSQLYPGQKSILLSILTSANSYNNPLTRYYYLLGYNFTIGFYKPTGEKIELEDS